MMRVAALVLAAGRATRYRAAGGQAATKLVELFSGLPLVRHPVAAAVAAALAPTVVVTGHAAAAVQDALAGLSTEFVHNPDYASGLASSLKAGLAALPPTIDAVVVLLGDMPLVDASIIQALVAGAAAEPGAAAVVPLVDGRRGNPVLLRRLLFAAAGDLAGDEGARRLLRDPALRVLEVPMHGAATRLDIDEPDGLTRAAAAVRDEHER